MPPNKLTQAEIETRLKGFPEWKIVDGKLTRELKFPSFVDAFAFMTKVASIAEELNHHPEWFNVYSLVRIQLATHDIGAIGPLDFELAGRINNLVKS